MYANLYLSIRLIVIPYKDENLQQTSGFMEPVQVRSRINSGPVIINDVGNVMLIRQVAELQRIESAANVQSLQGHGYKQSENQDTDTTKENRSAGKKG